MKYKIGDMVEIRSWEDMENQYGLDEDGDINCPGIFTKDMSELCGKLVDIVDVFYINYNKPIHVYQIKESEKFFYNEMFTNA